MRSVPKHAVPSPQAAGSCHGAGVWGKIGQTHRGASAWLAPFERQQSSSPWALTGPWRREENIVNQAAFIVKSPA